MPEPTEEQVTATIAVLNSCIQECEERARDEALEDSPHLAQLKQASLTVASLYHAIGAYKTYADEAWIVARSAAAAMDVVGKECRAWSARFPEHEYRPQDDCVALKVTSKEAG